MFCSNTPRQFRRLVWSSTSTIRSTDIHCFTSPLWTTIRVPFYTTAVLHYCAVLYSKMVHDQKDSKSCGPNSSRSIVEQTAQHRRTDC
eukprot:3744176-Amphidinium_carterae.5